MPVASPAQLQFRDSNLAPAFMSVATLRTNDEEGRCATFRQRMGVTRELLGAKLIANLLVDLTSAGFETSKAEGVTPVPNTLRRRDDRESRRPEAVLCVAFADAGMATRLWSSSYEPRVNVSAHLMAAPDSADWLSTDFFYYGADASGDTAWSIPADPRYRFASMQAMVENPDDVVNGFDVAVRMLSKRVVARVCGHARLAARVTHAQ
ncbi:hypothetical protein [Variovorax sp. M-6]|uniref:hypothetical protein n=1 Tax=Variovorax sp. M-6 TaxID=3233041 RepID=UPI003F976A19